MSEPIQAVHLRGTGGLLPPQAPSKAKQSTHKDQKFEHVSYDCLSNYMLINK